jgi:hypothetical protein
MRGGGVILTSSSSLGPLPIPLGLFELESSSFNPRQESLFTRYASLPLPLFSNCSPNVVLVLLALNRSQSADVLDMADNFSGLDISARGLSTLPPSLLLLIPPMREVAGGATVAVFDGTNYDVFDDDHDVCPPPRTVPMSLLSFMSPDMTSMVTTLSTCISSPANLLISTTTRFLSCIIPHKLKDLGHQLIAP